MNKINQITEKYKDLPYMDHKRALYLRKIIHQYKLKSLCELGHYHGKSSIYLGAILEEQGFGKLLTFDIISNKVSPNIKELIKEYNLEKYVIPIVSEEGYAWDLARLINNRNQSFDFCYIDGGHTFESTTIAFVLTDILLEKNGILIFDDISWTLNKVTKSEDDPLLKIPMHRSSTNYQKSIEQVRMVCDTIVSRYNYSLIEVIEDLDWIVFKKN